jgi:hypothetical protein
MRLSRVLYFTAILLLLFLTVLAADYYRKLKNKPAATVVTPVNNELEVKLKSLALELIDFNDKQSYNDETAFIIDMSIASGSNRFFIYDLKNRVILASSLVTHGRCNKTWLAGRAYSNVVGSGCTSVGKYKIGKAYYGKFGLAYKLHGLDETNSNAFKRYVVLHAHECVPEAEIDPYPLCQSDGCPTVSPGFLKRLQTIIDNSNKPVLLSISQ